MQRDRIRACILAAFTALLLGAAVVVLDDVDAENAGAAADPPVTATVGSTPSGQPMAQGFTGLSLEYGALHSYTGRDPDHINTVLLNLLRNLVPGGQTSVLRIGGNSADRTWWPIRGVVPPGGISYRLTEGWIRTTQAMAAQLGARLILDLNLASGRPGIAAAEARALLAGVGRRYIQAFEIGNEPDVYSLFPWYRDRRGRVFFARGKAWGLSRFITQFARWRALLPKFPVAGPAFAELTWLTGVARFIAAEPGLRVLTLHRYPLRACVSGQARGQRHLRIVAVDAGHPVQPGQCGGRRDQCPLAARGRL